MATASELVLINNLIRKMNFDENATVSDGGEVRESPRHMSSSEELLVTERVIPVAGRVSVDDEGFPIVFFQILQRWCGPNWHSDRGSGRHRVGRG
jgi:hypothetical protein